MSNSDLNDRDRLAAVFDTLRSAGWFAPFIWGTQMCCTDHGWDALFHAHGVAPDSTPEELDVVWNQIKSLWWTAPADSHAFMPESEHREVVLTPEVEAAWVDVMDKLSHGSVDEIDVAHWVAGHTNEIRLSSHLARTQKYNTMLWDLALNWSGGEDAAQEAVTALRSAGLLVSAPEGADDPIRVHPLHRELIIKDVDQGAVRFNGMVLSGPDVERLILMLKKKRHKRRWMSRT